jgi:type IV pilus assembly protein PilC
MPTYKYSGRDGAGQPAAGRIEADDEQQAIAQLTSRGYFLTRLELDRDLKTDDIKRLSLKSLFKGKVTARDLAIFCRQLGVLYSVGVPILSALQAIRDQQGSDSPLGSALQRVLDRLQQGEGLAGALQEDRAFPSILVNMVAAGEVGGSLDDSLRRAATYFEREYQVGQKVKSALTYPKFVAVFALAVSWFLLSTVVPNFAQIFASFDAKLPAITQFMLDLSHFVVRWGWAIGLSLLLLFLLYARWAVTPSGKGRMDRVRLRLPVFGKLTGMNALSRFCRTLAVLTHSGVNVVTALRLADQAADNAVYSKAVRAAVREVGAGGRIATELERSGLFPPMVIQMIAVGEDSGSLDNMLNQVADFYDQDIMTLTEQVGKLIEPIVIAFMAGIVGLIALSIALPMMQMANVIQF